MFPGEWCHVGCFMLLLGSWHTLSIMLVALDLSRLHSCFSLMLHDVLWLLALLAHHVCSCSA